MQDKNDIILIIINVGPDDAGDYLLKVENEMGEITCRTTIVIKGMDQTVALPDDTLTITETTRTVTREERIITTEIQPEEYPLEPEIYVREHGIARLECKVDSYPPPVVTWFVNGMEIRPSPHYEMSYDDGKSVLLIIEVSPEDTGEYTCKAQTEMGEQVCSTTLYVQGKAIFMNNGDLLKNIFNDGAKAMFQTCVSFKTVKTC